MKRLNRKKIITELEWLRSAMYHVMLEAKVDNIGWKVKSYGAYYDNADKLIVELGGESNKDIQDEILEGWKKIDKSKLEDIKKYVSDEVGYTMIDSENKQYGASDDAIIEMIFKKFILRE